MPLMAQELATLPKTPELIPGFRGVLVVQSLVICILLCGPLWKKIDGQQFHQYQQNEQNHLWLNTKN